MPLVQHFIIKNLTTQQYGFRKKIPKTLIKIKLEPYLSEEHFCRFRKNEICTCSIPISNADANSFFVAYSYIMVKKRSP